MTRPSGDVRPLVVGLGNPDRGDDGVGVAVARRVAALAGYAVRVVVTADPTDLVHLLDTGGTVVVTDAVRTGAAPGSVHVLDAGMQPLPSGDQPHSSHALGLAGSVEIARALGHMPDRLVVVGVETTGHDVGAMLSEAVAAAVEPAAYETLAACAQPTARA